MFNPMSYFLFDLVVSFLSYLKPNYADPLLLWYTHCTFIFVAVSVVMNVLQLCVLFIFIVLSLPEEGRNVIFRCITLLTTLQTHWTNCGGIAPLWILIGIVLPLLMLVLFARQQYCNEIYSFVQVPVVVLMTVACVCVCQSSRSKQQTMFVPAKLTVIGVFNQLRDIASMSGNAVSAQ